MAQGNIRIVLYTFRSGRCFTFSRFAIRNAITSCITMFTAVQTTVISSADRKPESKTSSARS